MVHFTIEAKPAVTEDVKELARDVGETVSEEADETEMVGRFDPHSRARQGETIEAVVDTPVAALLRPRDRGRDVYSDEGKGAQA